MLGGHWDISRRNHSTHVYTTLSPYWDTRAECVSWVPHLQVKRPTEQSVSSGHPPKEKAWESPHWNAAVAKRTKRSLYNVFGGIWVSADNILKWHLQWNYPINISNDIWYIYFAFIQITSAQGYSCFFSPKQWNKRWSTHGLFKQKD